VLARLTGGRKMSSSSSASLISDPSSSARRATMATYTDESGYIFAPGTVTLEDLHRSTDQLVLQPPPTSDPNDSLNWSKFRKALNFGLVSYYVLWTFVQLDIGFTAWGPLIEEYNLSLDVLNASAAVNYGGLAIGCIFFIPFVHKYGRRPLYIFSVVVQLASCIWQAEVTSGGSLIGANILSGLGGAISETVVQITIADVFFVHQHATMNGWYLVFTSVGAFLGPVASGYVVISQGWRWMWWWCVIFIGINLIAVIFGFEESKYIPVLTGSRATVTQGARRASLEGTEPPKDDIKAAETGAVEQTTSHVDTSIPMKTYKQRLALITKTDAPIVQHFWQPVAILFTFPAVAYTALTYGGVLATFAIMTSVQATYLLLPPYNFGAQGIGLMNLPPFIGGLFGFVVGGYLNDWSAKWLAKRNQGIFEPEMRLWLALPATLTIPAGILIFGFGLANGVHWIVLAVGYAIWGFGFVVSSDVALAYCTDCYQDIVGDALVGVM
jgi:MFS family permease